MLGSTSSPDVAGTAAGSLLQDPGHRSELLETGWTVVPLFEPHQVEALRAGYEQTRPGKGWGFDIDFAVVDPDYKRVVSATIEPLLTPALDAVIDEHRLFLTSYVTKWPGPESKVPLHQDWSYVDEDEEGALVLWAPLIDTSPELDNGCLSLVPRSHRLYAPWRGANSIPWYEPYRGVLEPLLEPLTLAAGEAVIFDARLLHGSAPNRSEAARPAVTARLCRPSAQLRYCHVAAESHWEVFAVDEDFFIERGPIDLRVRPPEGEVIERRSLADIPPLDTSRFEQFCGIEQLPEPTEPTTDYLGLTPRREAGGRRPAVIRHDEDLTALREASDGEVRRSVRLEPGDRLHGLPDTTGAEAVTVVVTAAPPRSGGAILRVDDQLVPLRVGTIVDLDPDADIELWNQEGDHVDLVVVRPRDDRRTRLGVRFRIRRLLGFRSA